MEENIDKAVDNFEKENKKFELALQIAEGDKEKAQKLITGEIKNIAAIKGAFKDEAVNINGLFILFVNLDKKAVERIFTVVSFEELVKNIPPYLKWPEFEKKIIDIEWGGKNLVNQSSDLKNDLQSTITFEYMDKIIGLVNDNKEDDLKELFKEIVTKALTLETTDLIIAVELSNDLYLALEGHADEKKEEVTVEEVVVQQEESNEVIVEGTLEISPVKGINITQLIPGTTILVRLPDRTSRDKYYLNLLQLVDGKKILPVPAVVRSVNYDEISGYLVISEIKPGLVVKCIEQAQINVMTPEIAEKSQKVRSIRLFIIFLGLFLALLAGLYFYLYFKGII